ncbi:hypothetical protein WICPIJ_010022 [Wickerhamomyces pijperi]|uniref:Secreted protein n=1 Tax=Wickerhamomyces pijperi TaxID=599730 RepID=A0A9P8PIW0_WICPI|nr:hypothetical protein WICPIJ_010022 [Wickerhamomyces pijperi]
MKLSKSFLFLVGVTNFLTGTLQQNDTADDIDNEYDIGITLADKPVAPVPDSRGDSTMDIRYNPYKPFIRKCHLDYHDKYVKAYSAHRDKMFSYFQYLNHGFFGYAEDWEDFSGESIKERRSESVEPVEVANEDLELAAEDSNSTYSTAAYDLYRKSYVMSTKLQINGTAYVYLKNGHKHFDFFEFIKTSDFKTIVKECQLAIHEAFVPFLGSPTSRYDTMFKNPFENRLIHHSSNYQTIARTDEEMEKDATHYRYKHIFSIDVDYNAVYFYSLKYTFETNHGSDIMETLKGGRFSISLNDFATERFKCERDPWKPGLEDRP